MARVFFQHITPPSVEAKLKKWREDTYEGKVLELFDQEGSTINLINRTKGLYNTIILKPPKEYTKVKFSEGQMTTTFEFIKDHLCRILAAEGLIITYGDQSIVMGKRRGFFLEQLVVVHRNAKISDLMISVERKE